MPEVRLRNLDVSLPEEVELIQAVVNRRFPPKFKEDFRNGEIDIKTPEEEAKVQAEIDKKRFAFQTRVTAVAHNQVSQVEEEKKSEDIEIKGAEPDHTAKVKCQVCGSKISRHKPNCPELKK